MLYALPYAHSSPAPFAVRDGFDTDGGFREDLREFICRRLEGVDPYRESKEYTLQQEKAFRLYERLRESLSEEGRAILLEYSEAVGAAHCLETALLAERAFLEGIRIVTKAFCES